MGSMISEKYAAWQAECEERFQQLKILMEVDLRKLACFLRHFQKTFSCHDSNALSRIVLAKKS